MDANERSIVGTTMTGHALVHTFELSIPVLIPAWVSGFDVTLSTIGIVVGAGYALFGFGSLPAGLLSDRYPTEPLVAACFAGMSLAFIAISVAPSLPVLTLALLCWGLAASIYHPVGLSIISRGVSRQGKALGYHGIAGNVGIALGPLVTIVLVSLFGWRVAAAALAVPGLLAAPLVLRFGFDEDEIPGAGGASPAGASGSSGAGEGDGTAGGRGGDIGPSDRAVANGGVSLAAFTTLARRTFSGLFVVVFVIVVFEGLYYRGALTFLPDLLGDFSTFGSVDFFGRSLEPSRYLYVGLLTVGIAGQYTGGWLSDRVDPTAGVTVAFVGLATIAVLFIPAATAGLVPLIVVSALLGFMIFGVQPLFQATVAQHSTADTRGSSYGFVYARVFGVGALGAVVTGFLLTYASPSALFAFLALVALSAAATAVFLYSRT